MTPMTNSKEPHRKQSREWSQCVFWVGTNLIITPIRHYRCFKCFLVWGGARLLPNSRAMRKPVQRIVNPMAQMMLSTMPSGSSQTPINRPKKSFQNSCQRLWGGWGSGLMGIPLFSEAYRFIVEERVFVFLKLSRGIVGHGTPSFRIDIKDSVGCQGCV